jgi:hypothetical protein
MSSRASLGDRAIPATNGAVTPDGPPDIRPALALLQDDRPLRKP